MNIQIWVAYADETISKLYLFFKTWFFRLSTPLALGTDGFDIEKSTTFAYEEIFTATDGFSDSSLLGHGTYGSVYYGILRDQVSIYIAKTGSSDKNCSFKR